MPGSSHRRQERRVVAARRGRAARRTDGSGRRTGDRPGAAEPDRGRQQRWRASRALPKNSSGSRPACATPPWVSAWCRSADLLALPPAGARPQPRTGQGDRVHHHRRRDRARQDDDRKARRSAGASHPQFGGPWPRVGGAPDQGGKDPKGTVRLSAVYAGAEVAISVADDGAASITSASAPRPKKTASSRRMPS